MLPLGPRVAHQGDTAVLTAHRGRGLGLGLKGVMIRVDEQLGMAVERTELLVAHDIEALAAAPRRLRASGPRSPRARSGLTQRGEKSVVVGGDR